MRAKIAMLLVLCGALLAPKALGATYTITVNTDAGPGVPPHGTVTPGTCVVPAGSDKTFAFTPDADYLLAGVWIDGTADSKEVVCSTSNGFNMSYTFHNVSSNHIVYVLFYPAPIMSSFSPASPADVAVGDPQMFSVEASSTMQGPEYQWYLDGVKIVGATIENWTYTPIAADIGAHNLEVRVWDKNCAKCGSYVAQSWAVTVYDPAANYTITASAGAHGTISPNGTQTVAALGSQTFTITPEAGYVINDVQVDGGYDYSGKGVTFGTANGFLVTCTFSNVLDNHVLQVSFRQAVALTSTPTSPVYVPAGSSQAFHVDAVEPLGDPVEYQWYLDSTSLPGSTASTWTYSPTLADVGTHEVKIRVRYSGGDTYRGHSREVWTVVVYDPAATYTITASAGSGGSISPSGAVTINAGANQTFAILANSGYKVTSVTVDGTSVGAQSSYTFSNVTASHTIAAMFGKQSSGGGGGGGGGGCSIVTNFDTPTDLLGWLAPYALIIGFWLASRRKAARA